MNKKPKILLIDENKVLGEKVKDFLENSGFDVEIETSPIDAMFLMSIPKAWDAIIIDDESNETSIMVIEDMITKHHMNGILLTSRDHQNISLPKVEKPHGTVPNYHKLVNYIMDFIQPLEKVQVM